MGPKNRFVFGVIAGWVSLVFGVLMVGCGAGGGGGSGDRSGAGSPPAQIVADWEDIDTAVDVGLAKAECVALRQTADRHEVERR